jgi:hypothetical protein
MCPEVTVSINGTTHSVAEGNSLFVPHQNKEALGFLIVNNDGKVFKYIVTGIRKLEPGSIDEICNTDIIRIEVS